MTNVFLFEGLGEEHLEKIFCLMRRVELPAGAIFLKEAEEGGTLYILRRGEVEVSKNLTLPIEKPDGRSYTEKALTRVSDRDQAVFGELVLFEERRRSATVKCLTPCTFYELHKDDFLRLAAKDEKIGYHLWKNLARMLSERLCRTNEDVIKLATALTIALSR